MTSSNSVVLLWGSTIVGRVEAGTVWLIPEVAAAVAARVVCLAERRGGARVPVRPRFAFTVLGIGALRLVDSSSSV